MRQKGRQTKEKLHLWVNAPSQSIYERATRSWMCYLILNRQAMFLVDHIMEIISTVWVEGHQRNIFINNYFQIGPILLDKFRHFSLFLMSQQLFFNSIHLRKTSPAPWEPCVSKNRNTLREYFQYSRSIRVANIRLRLDHRLGVFLIYMLSSQSSCKVLQ